MNDDVLLWLENKNKVLNKNLYISDDEIEAFYISLKKLLFNEYYYEYNLKELIYDINQMLKSFLLKLKYSKKELDKLIDSFIISLIEIEKKLRLDLKQFILTDPAISNEIELVLASLPFDAIIGYRIANSLSIENIFLLPDLIMKYIKSKTGIDISPYAQIGEGFVIDHGVGVVIGETTIIGNNVKLYHGVTLGAKKILNPKELKNMKRHPTIEDNVIICSNSSILGDVTIKRNSIIGASNIVNKDVEENSIIRGKSYEGGVL